MVIVLCLCGGLEGLSFRSWNLCLEHLIRIHLSGVSYRQLRLTDRRVNRCCIQCSLLRRPTEHLILLKPETTYEHKFLDPGKLILVYVMDVTEIVPNAVQCHVHGR